jgi:ferredoxin-type protein NapH
LDYKNILKKIKDIALNNIWVLLFIYFFVAIEYPIFGILALVCMLAPVITAFFLGRKWCGNFCPRGNFSDKILSKISFKKNFPKFIKTNLFRGFVLFVILYVFVYQLMYVKNFDDLGIIFIRMVFVTTVLAVILGIFFKPRIWCVFCPMGTISTFVSSISKRVKKIIIEKDKCVSCNICNKNCPMEIKITDNEKEIEDPNCIKCYECVKSCKMDAFKKD